MIPPGKTHSVRLCATFVKTVNVPGRYGDGYGGHGLSLLVTPRKSGGFSKTWAQAISPNGTKTSLGLGSYPVVTLAMARERALANARAIAEGRDPRRHMRQVPTFAQANETVLAIHAEHWKSERTWLHDWIGTPPHCPFDNVILQPLLSKLNNELCCENGDKWTQMDCPCCYLTWVRVARASMSRSGYRSLSEWELREFNRRTAATVK